MRTWGLTGGIASGKTTVARLFGEHGVPVVDADALYHQLIAPVLRPAALNGADRANQVTVASPLASAIASAFPGSLQPDGSLHRAALGKIVFAERAARRRLEAITHPAVSAAAADALQALARRGIAHALYDVPLLFERNLAGQFAGVIVVWVPPEVQLARMCSRDGHDEAAARLRLEAQLPIDDKKRRATFVVDNSGTLDHTRSQVEEVLQRLQAAPSVLAPLCHQAN